MERDKIHNNQEQGYSLKKGRVMQFLQEHNFELSDLALKIGISEHELQERLDDWDYWNAEELESIIEFFGASVAYKIIYFPTRNEKAKVGAKVFRRKRWAKRKD